MATRTTRRPAARGRIPTKDQEAPPASDVTPSLPAWKAFLVQFTLSTGSAPAVFEGRVEHLHSGRRLRFDSQQTLLAALSRLLASVDPERPK